jgi:DNA-binding FadR family transcriptional regulator
MTYKSTDSQRERLYHTVVEHILQSIRAGDYRPGSRLPSERELADKYQVSRVTIREATIALEAKGAIDIKAGSGAFVREFSAASELALPDVSAFDLTTARMIFEAEAAALASANITDAQLHKLADIVDAMASSKVGGVEDSDDLDRQFHMTIASAARDATKARAAMREHFHRLFETMVSAQESAALDELRTSIGTARARFLQATAA